MKFAKVLRVSKEHVLEKKMVDNIILFGMVVKCYHVKSVCLVVVLV